MKRCYHRGSSWLELFFATWPVWLQCRLMPLILCVSPQIRRRWDTNVVKNIRIFILKSSRNSLFSCCLTGAEGKQASISVPWGVLLHLPHAHSPLSCLSGGSGLTALHFASSATNAEVSLPFWLLKMWYLPTSTMSGFINLHSAIFAGQLVWSLSDLAKKKKDRKITYFLQLKHILSKICLPLSVKYFIRTRKPFHPMLYTLILIHCFIFLGCTKWWHT